MTESLPNHSRTPEIWEDIAGYKDMYRVSSYGRVRSLPRLSANGRQLKGRIMRSTANQAGHLKLHLSKYGDQFPVCIHLLVLSAFIGGAPDGHIAHHKDGNMQNNRLCNLEWVVWGFTNTLHHHKNQEFVKRRGRKAMGKLIKNWIEQKADKEREISEMRNNVRELAEELRTPQWSKNDSV